MTQNLNRVDVWFFFFISLFISPSLLLPHSRILFTSLVLLAHFHRHDFFLSLLFHLMDVREPCWLCIVPFWFLSLLGCRWWKSYLNSSLFPFWLCHIFIVTGFLYAWSVGWFAKWTEMVQRGPLNCTRRKTHRKGQSKVFVTWNACCQRGWRWCEKFFKKLTYSLFMKLQNIFFVWFAFNVTCRVNVLAKPLDWCVTNFIA